jgi:hypothetical protein
MPPENNLGMSVDADPFGIRSPVKFQDLTAEQQELLFYAAEALTTLRDTGLDTYRILATLPDL